MSDDNIVDKLIQERNEEEDREVAEAREAAERTQRWAAWFIIELIKQASPEQKAVEIDLPLPLPSADFITLCRVVDLPGIEAYVVAQTPDLPARIRLSVAP